MATCYNCGKTECDCIAACERGTCREHDLQKVEYLLAHVKEQVLKRQYLNATHAAQELSMVLLKCFSSVLKDH
jgi:hypothetical protein